MNEQGSNSHWNGVDPFEKPRKEVAIFQGEPDPQAKVADLTVPVLQNIDSTYYDAHQGSENTLVRSTFVRTELNGQLLVTNLVERALIPDQNETADTLNLEPVTMIEVGGGSSTAMANIGQFGYIEDAQNSLIKQQGNSTAENKMKYRIDNIIALSNTAGAPRSEKQLDTDTLRNSAEHLYQALKKARKDGSIKVNSKIILMGASAGGALCIELAALMAQDTSQDRMDPQQLLLSEPAGISERPQLMKDIVFSGVRAAFQGAREKNLGLRDTLKFVKDDMVTSMTQPQGAPEGIRDMIGLQPKGIPDESGKIHDPAKEHVNIGEVFRIPNPVTSEAINFKAIATDSTEPARNLIKIPVIIEWGFRSRAVNAYEGHNLLTPKEVATLDITDPKVVAATEQLKKQLFKNAPQVIVDLDDSPGHSTLGRQPDTWERFLGAAMRIPLPESV